MMPREMMTIEHGKPKRVELLQIEEELEALWGESVQPAGERRTYARTLTLAIFCESDDPPEVMDELVGHIITRYSARAIVIRADPEASEAELEAWIHTHCLTREEGVTELCAEQITLHAHGDSIREVHSSILSLRLGNLPLVVWWRAQPDLENPLFLQLLRAGDQMILDSARFTAPALQLGGFVGRLYREFGDVPFGDINWARLNPWRELIAQFFDKPEHLRYLRQLSDIKLEYSARDGGNPAQAVLLAMWLATMLNWQVVGGSWKSEGKGRSLRFLDSGRDIQVEIHESDMSDSRPGWLESVTLHSGGETEATFQVRSCGENCATTHIKIGDSVTERMAALTIPDEVELVCSEFDAAQRDRVYHHALRVLEQLLA